MKKTITILNTLALIMLILSYDVIMALESTKLKKANLNSSSKIKVTKNSATQAHPTEPNETTQSHSAPSTPSKNSSIPINSKLSQINNLDQSGTTIQNDPYASKSVNSQVYSTCKAKFYNLIAALPDSLQAAILTEFSLNGSTANCCEAEKLIKSVSAVLNSQVKLFADLLTNQQQKSKKGFVCFRAPEIVAKEEDLPLEKSFSDKNKEFISKLLLEQNTLSSSLLKCVSAINKISIRNIGLMCSTNEMLEKLFNKEAGDSTKFSSIKKFPDDDKDIYSECVEYVKNYDSFSNTVLGAYVDSLNFLIGTDKCNYFSNLFTMDPLKDKEDPYLPKDLAELAQSASNQSNNQGNTTNNAKLNDANSSNVDSPNALLDTWFACAAAKSEFASAAINDLKSNIMRAQFTNPFGLSTYIGRADINYSLIKQKFDLINFPFYHVKCSQIEGCIASFKGSSHAMLTDLAGVITGSQTKLEVSCCNFICVVYVKIEDMLNNQSYSATDTKQLEGAEVFKMKSDRNSLEISSLDLLEIRNAKNCFDKNSVSETSFVENKKSQQTKLTTNNNKILDILTELRTNKEKTFSNANLIKILSGLNTNSASYENDFRLKTSTMLKVTFDGKTRTLNDLLYDELFKAENIESYLQCESGSCLLQQSSLTSDINATSITDKTFKLEANIDKAAISLVSRIAKRKSRSSRSSKSSKSSKSSSKSYSRSSKGSSFSKPSSFSKSSGSKSYSSSSKGSSFSKPYSSSSSYNSGNFNSNSGTNYGSSSNKGSTKSSFNGSNSKSNGFDSAYNYGKNGSTKNYSGNSSSTGSSFNSNNYSGSNGFNSATNYKPNSSGSNSSSYGSSFNKSLYPSTNKNNLNNLNNFSNNNNKPTTNKYNDNNNNNNNFFNNHSNSNNYSMTKNNYYNNNNNYNSSSNSIYASKIKVSSNPFSSFNSNYYNNLYDSNYSYTSLKVKTSNPITSFSSYNNGYNSYYSNSYKNSIKIKNKSTTKIKIKYYPSYTYNPIYSNIFYPYNRYYQYNYNPYYYRPNYYNYYYQNQSYYNNNPAYSGYSFNDMNLMPEYNAEDWLPSYKPYFDRENYLKSLNTNLNNVKIYSQCCETWCAVVIQNVNDGLKSENFTKQRIYVEVILKNYAFFDSSVLNASQKKCLIENIQINLTANTLKDNNIFSKCNIKSPYDVIPIKRNCLKNMNDHCKANGFADLMDKSSVYIQSADLTGNECSAPVDCLSADPTEAQKLACGASLYSLFSANALKPAFKSFIVPCAKSHLNYNSHLTSNNDAPRITAMIEKFKKQTPPKDSKNASSSNVVNLNDFTVEQKAKLENVNLLAENQINHNIAIDNNTATRVNTNTDADAKLINSSTDSEVASVIVDSNSSTDGSYNNYDSQYNGGITRNSGSFSRNSYFNMLIVILIIWLV